MSDLLTAEIFVREQGGVFDGNDAVPVPGGHMLWRQQLRSRRQLVDVKSGVPLEDLLHVVKQVHNVVQRVVGAGHVWGGGGAGQPRGRVRVVSHGGKVLQEGGGVHLSGP